MHILLHLCVIISLIPSYQWFYYRTLGSEATWLHFALVPSIITLGFLARDKRPGKQSVTLAGIALYAACWIFHCPGLIKATLATAILLYHFGLIHKAGISSLAIINLPWISSLEFFLSFPLRRLVTELSGAALKTLGLEVETLGTGIFYFGETVFVDPPCSGIKMLWSGALLCALLCSIYRLSWLQSAGLLCCATVTLILANTLRGCILFFPEAQIVAWPHWTHSGVGSLIYLASSLGLVTIAQKLYSKHEKSHPISHPCPTH